MREMHGLELVWDLSARCVGVVDADRQDEERGFRHVARAVDGVAPFAAEVGFKAALSGGGDDRDEEGAARDIALDLAIVVVATLEAFEVEPGFDARRVQSGLQLLDSGEVFAGVTDEDCVVRHLALRRQEALRSAKRDHIAWPATYAPAPVQ